MDFIEEGAELYFHEWVNLEEDAPNSSTQDKTISAQQSLINVLELKGGKGKLIDCIKARAAMGEAKYGTPLYPRNGRNAIRDAFQENLDLLVYLEQRLLETEPGSPVYNATQAIQSAALHLTESMTMLAAVEWMAWCETNGVEPLDPLPKASLP